VTPSMPVVTAKQLVHVVGQLGFRFDRQKGSHAVYIREMDKARVVIPMHVGKDIRRKTLAGILSDIGITIEEFRAYLR
jgi:predicted RNA binding protein YcfA (HicA-like mRNA interferase family)